MTDSLVVDSSALVALLIDDGPTGQWVTEQVRGRVLAVPELAPFEAANVIRRRLVSGALDAVGAALAHEDLLDLTLSLWPYEALAARAWELRHGTTVYDASYVALAELLDAPLLTLDARLSRAEGHRCDVLTPPKVSRGS